MKKSLKLVAAEKFAAHMEMLGFRVNISPGTCSLSCCRHVTDRTSLWVAVRVWEGENPEGYKKISKKFLEEELSKFGLEMQHNHYYSDGYPRQRRKRKKFLVRRCK